jgi:hypothetical protein
LIQLVALVLQIKVTLAAMEEQEVERCITLAVAVALVRQGQLQPIPAQQEQVERA